MRERVASRGSGEPGEGLAYANNTLTLPRLRRGPLPLPRCGRGAIALSDQIDHLSIPHPRVKAHAGPVTPDNDVVDHKRGWGTLVVAARPPRQSLSHRHSLNQRYAECNHNVLKIFCNCCLVANRYIKLRSVCNDSAPVL